MRVSRKTTDQFGNQLKTKDGKPYTRLSLQTTQHADRWLSGFDGPRTQDWAEGKEVEIEVVESDRKDKMGRPYLNFSLPKVAPVTKEEFDALVMRVEILEKQSLSAGPQNAGTPVEDEINIDDVPL